MGKAADLLAEQLEEAQERIMELEREVSNLQEAQPWTDHIEPEEDDLPVPRLELMWESGDFRNGYNHRCCYRLVYRHLLGHLIGVPLGETLRGGEKDPDAWGKLELPFRDSAHARNDARQLELPAFVRFNDKVEQIGTKEQK